jgi:integrase
MTGTSAVIETQEPKKRKREYGSGRIWKIGRRWWVQWQDASGQQRRESSGSSVKGVATDLLQKRLEEKQQGTLPILRSQSVRFEELRDALIADYRANNRKWLRTGKDKKQYICGIKPLEDFFGGFRAMEITTDRMRDFIAKRQEEGVTNGTINSSLALLRRMFRLAVQDRKIREVPYFPMLKPAPPRKGFLEHAEFTKLRAELPEYLRSIITMGYFTGMRLGEILGLRWTNINLADGQVRLDTTKNDDTRNVPITGELLEMLKIEREKNTKAEFVFNLKGERIKSFRKAWKSACDRAKLPELLFHDLRRTGVRNLVRAGVPERVAMAISGHRTRSTFERHNITSERDLREAAKKLETYINGQAKPAQEAIPILAPSDPKGSEQSETQMNDLYGDSTNKIKDLQRFQ